MLDRLVWRTLLGALVADALKTGENEKAVSAGVGWNDGGRTGDGTNWRASDRSW